jgi:hypothetical protein
MHGAAHAIKKREQASIGNYKLSVWKAKIDEKKSSPELKGLRDEIAICRILLQERLELCTTNVDLMVHSASIMNMVDRIEKVVTSCHKLEGSMGLLLDKQAILQFAERVIRLISEAFPEDPEKLSLLADRIIEAVSAKDVDYEVVPQAPRTTPLALPDVDEDG